MAAIFVAGVVLRLMAIAYLAKVSPHMLTWGANEAGGIARWIVTDHSFSSPFHDAHGPTAWLGPVYPGIVAVAFLLFGVQTSASALAVMWFNAICSAAAGVVVYELGRQIHSERAGLLGGWMWALSPYAAILPYILWDTALSALFFGGALLLTIRLPSSTRVTAWMVCGAAWGVAALLNPALLTPLPFLLWWLSDRGRKWRLVAATVIVTVIVIIPWTVRNYVVFRQIVPVRSNGLSEIYFANCGFETHPLGPSMKYQSLGEAAFTGETGRAAVECVQSEPMTFVRHALQRAWLFWVYPINFWPLSLLIDLGALAGLITLFRKSARVAWPVMAVLAVYPLLYYASQVVSRYRHPIDPVLYALAGVGLSGIGYAVGRLGNRGTSRKDPPVRA